jgi:hypothetical protein
MSDALKKLLAESGITPEDYEAQRRYVESGEHDPLKPFAPKRGVQDSPELKRILSLPKREWEVPVLDSVKDVSGYLRNPDWYKTPEVQTKLREKQPVKTPTLRPIQVQSIIDMHDYGGLFGPQRVGAGKTLTSLFAPIILDARKPILIIPAKLVEKTRREMHNYRKTWLVPGVLRIVSYELLGRPQAAKLLEEHSPDLIILDECHKVKNTKAAVTKRIKRYMEEHPETRMVALSGTITKRSLHDYAHIAAWCLKRTNPTPRGFQDRMEWSMVIDEKPRANENFGGKLAPGALIQFCDEDEERELYSSEPIRAVRRGYRKRLVRTPGVVATQDGPLADCSLIIDSEVLVLPEQSVSEAVREMRQNWTRPDGEPMMDAIELWRHLHEIACGFFYRWNPNPPKDWRDARKAWSKAVRDVLKNNRRGLDSESQVWRAVESGEYPIHTSTLDTWKAVRPSYKPQTEAVWMSRTVLDRCASWMESEKGIVWVDHVEFGSTLAALTGASFYQRGGVDQRNQAIEDHKHGTPMICSIRSNSEGRNMQAWNKNLIVSPPTSGQIWEQMLGRTHRDGQEEDEVYVTLLVVLKEQAEAFARAKSDARYISDTTGQEQKLCYADIDVIDPAQAPVLPNGTR